MMTACFVMVPVILLYVMFGGLTLRNIEDAFGFGKKVIRIPVRVKQQNNNQQQNQNPPPNNPSNPPNKPLP